MCGSKLDLSSSKTTISSLNSYSSITSGKVHSSRGIGSIIEALGQEQDVGHASTPDQPGRLGHTFSNSSLVQHWSNTDKKARRAKQGISPQDQQQLLGRHSSSPEQMLDSSRECPNMFISAHAYAATSGAKASSVYARTLLASSFDWKNRA